GHRTTGLSAFEMDPECMAMERLLRRSRCRRMLRATAPQHIRERRRLHENRSTRCQSAVQHLLRPLALILMEFQSGIAGVGMIMRSDHLWQGDHEKQRTDVQGRAHAKRDMEVDARRSGSVA